MSRGRWWVFLLVVAAAAACTPTASQNPSGEGQNELVVRYGPALRSEFQGDLVAESEGRPFYTLRVTLTVDDEAVRFAGTEQVRVTNTSADRWDRVVFRLYPNLENYGGDLTVRSAAVDGQTVTPVLDETRSVMELPLSEPLTPGKAVDIDLSFETTIIPGHEALYNQFSYLHGVLAAPNFFPLLSVYEAGGGWWRQTDYPQGDAVFSETAFFDVWLTAPADWVVATSGVTLSETPGEDEGTVIYEIIAPLMRDFVVMAGADYTTVLSQTVDGVRVNVYAYEDEGLARTGLDVTVEAMRVYSTAFGQYPFAELDMVETPTAAGGIEYPGLIVIADSIWGPPVSYFDVVVAHEVSHQWWYSLVGNDQTLDPWMDESLAQYAVVVYFRQAVGERAAQERLDWYRGNADPYRGTPDDLPIGLPVSAYGDAYSDLVYSKGPLFFQALADLVGEDALLRGLRDYFTAYRYEVVDPADMLYSFEDTLGRGDLNGIFRQWVGDFAGLE